MDNSHVALVAVKLEATGFLKYRCDRPMPLGVNLNSLAKVLKCAKDDDQVTLKATDNHDVLNLLYESPTTDRIAEYEMKLMDIDADQLGIPDTEYDVTVTMSSSEFARIVRDLNNLGESVRIEVTKEGIRFTSEGDAANGSVLLKHSDEAARKLEKNGDSSQSGSKKANGAKVKKEQGEDEDETMEDAEEGSDDEGKKKKSKKSKDDDEEEEEEENQAEPEEEEEEEEEDTSSKKRKKSSSGKEKASKRPKKVRIPPFPRPQSTDELYRKGKRRNQKTKRSKASSSR
jgi:proliferating cell nuclear antigen